jgi:purine-binding chemotaxis protein CheW
MTSTSSFDLTSVQAILEERARILAQPPEALEDDGDVLEVAILAIGGERYACETARVQEVRPVAGVTRVPSLPPFWAGLINLRGSLYPVLDLGRYLGVPREKRDEDAEVAVVTGDDFSIGLLVDGVPQVRRVSVRDVNPPLSGGSGVVSGVTSDLVSIIDLGKLLSDPRLVVRDDVG